jgi:hypothetical protein
MAIASVTRKLMLVTWMIFTLGTVQELWLQNLCWSLELYKTWRENPDSLFKTLGHLRTIESEGKPAEVTQSLLF